ncbi:hypothetical protein D3C76_577430 [compost metagenome]
MFADYFDLAEKTGEVGRAASAILGDDLVAGAVVADVGAEGDVYIQRQGARSPAAVAQGVQHVEGSDSFVELHSGRVGGIARACQVIAADKICVPAYVVEHAHCPRVGEWFGQSREGRQYVC